MPAIEIGRVCLKMAGREAGRKAVVVDLLEKSFALIDGLHVKRRKCNIHHLFPLAEKLNIKKAAGHAEVLKVLGVAEKPLPKKKPVKEEKTKKKK